MTTLREIHDMVRAELSNKLPERVSRAQFKLALLAANKLTQFKTALSSASNSTQIYFADASNINRNSAAVSEIATALSLTQQQVDNFFLAASQITE